MRLPDEQEWQWAAQSARSDFVFPWGPDWRDGLANTDESEIDRTTAVGMYPGGDSLQQVADLAGNVWEWCRNQHEDPRQTRPGGEDPRVLRDTYWSLNQVSASAGFRYHALPDIRVINVGFRVVCSSPSADH